MDEVTCMWTSVCGQRFDECQACQSPVVSVLALVRLVGVVQCTVPSKQDLVVVEWSSSRPVAVQGSSDHSGFNTNSGFSNHPESNIAVQGPVAVQGSVAVQAPVATFQYPSINLVDCVDSSCVNLRWVGYRCQNLKIIYSFIFSIKYNKLLGA